MNKYLILGVFLITTSLQANNNEIQLVKQMCRSTLSTYGLNCRDEIFKTAIKKGCKKIAVYKHGNLREGTIPGLFIPFAKSDPYSNENKCYVFSGKLIQRISKRTGLFNGNPGLYLLTNLPQGRYSEGQSYVGVTKGTGVFKYDTVNNRRNIVSRGKVLSIEDE